MLFVERKNGDTRLLLYVRFPKGRAENISMATIGVPASGFFFVSAYIFIK